MRLIMVRHAQTDWNAEGRIQGHLDAQLSALGRAQAQRLVLRLAEESWDALYYSDSVRASDTAAPIIAARGGVAQPDPRLREYSSGWWEGLTGREVRERDPEGYGARRRDETARPGGGESLVDTAARALACLEDGLHQHGDGTVLWVAHGGVLRLVVCRLLGMPLLAYNHFRLDSASVSTIEIDEGNAVVTLWNDHRHTAGVR